MGGEDVSRLDCDLVRARLRARLFGQASAPLIANRFRLLERLGEGGMGVVYDAHDVLLDRRVALKTIRHLDPAGIYRFKQEFRALADVAHPNLVTLYEMMSTGKEWFFTMELVEGKDFLTWLRQTGRQASAGGPCAEVEDGLRPAFAQLVEGILALHSAGKLHRDIKPSNVLVSGDRRVVVLDFGLVTEVAPRGFLPNDLQFAGTPQYMAPEQFSGSAPSMASDWYAVGVMLFEALTGRSPFDEEPQGMLRSKRRGDLLPPVELAPATPLDLNALCLDLLRLEPAERPPGPEVLRRILHDERRSGSSGSARLPVAPTLLVGRQQHLATLHDAVATVARGRPVALHVHGVSGMGKTALVRSFLDGLVEGHRAVRLEGRCYERESVPYKGIDSLIDALSLYLRGLHRDEAAALMPSEIAVLARLFPVLRWVPAVAEAPKSELEGAEPHELRRRAFAALRELLARLAAHRLTIIFIDDLQWGDEDSASLLRGLLAPPHPPPILMITSARSEGAIGSALPHWPSIPSNGQAHWVDLRLLEVGPLPDEDAHSLALALLETTTTRNAGILARAEAIAEDARGSPFFIEELVRHLQEAAENSNDGQSPSVSITLADVVRARFTRLPEDALRLLELVAIASRPMGQSVFGRAAGVGQKEAATLALLRVHRMVRVHAPPGREEEVESFHDRIRESVIAHLDGERLKERHRSLALALEATGAADPEALAEHFAGAGELERASEHAVGAAEKAAEALAFDRAARLYRRAIELRPVEKRQNDEALRLQRHLAQALANAGRGADAGRHFLLAASRAAPVETLHLQQRAAEEFLRSGHMQEGMDAVRGVMQAAGMKLAATPRGALGRLLISRWQLALRGLSFIGRRESDIPAADLARIDLCWSLSSGLGLTDVIQGAHFQTRSLLLALRAGEPSRIARGMAGEAAFHATRGAKGIKRAQALVDRAQALAKRLDDPKALGIAALAHGVTANLRGDFGAAREGLTLAEGLLRDRCTGVAWELATARMFWIESLFYLGDLRAFARASAECLREATSRGDLFASTNFRSGLSHFAWLVAGDPARARSETQEARAAWPHGGFHAQHWFNLLAEANIDLYERDGEGALRRVKEAWAALSRSLLLRVELTRIAALDLKCRVLLSASRGADARGANVLLAAARRTARKLHAEAADWARALANLHLGQIANAVRGPNAAGLLKLALETFEAKHMALHAAVTKHALAAADPEHSDTLRAAVQTFMCESDVRDPAAFLGVFAPLI
jgi:serine/threonine protein kinase